MKNIYVLTILSLFIFQISKGQDIHNYFEYKASMDPYYDDLIKSNADLKGTGYKDYLRFVNFHNSRAGQDGNLDEYIKAMDNYYSSKSLKSATTTIEANWQFLGPIGFPTTSGNGTVWSVGKGMVWSIYVNPSDHDVIYAGANRGGLWRTTNGGDTWQLLTKDVYGVNGIKDILVDPNNSNIIYILTGFGANQEFHYSNGIFKSIDGGKTWVRKNTVSDINGNPTTFFPTGNSVMQPRKMAMDPDNPNIIYLVTYRYILKSTNAGESWNIIYDDGTDFWSTWATGPGLWDVAIVEGTSNNIVYVGGYKILRSADAGTSWSDETADYLTGMGKATTDNPMRTEISVHPNHPSQVWFLSWFNESGTSASYIVKTDDAFASTRTYYDLTNSRRTNFGTCWCYNIEVSPNSDDTVYIAQQSIKMFDGTSYTNIHCNASWSSSVNNYVACNNGCGPNDDNWIHPDIRDMVVLSENNEDVIFTGDDGGVTRSVAQNTGFWDWDKISDDGTCGLYVTEFYGIAGVESDPDLIVGGCQDLSNFVYDNGTWFHAGSGDGGKALIDYSNPNIMYVCSNGGFGRFSNRGITRDRTVLSQSAYSTPALAMHPSDPSIIFFGSGDLFRITSANATPSYDTITPTGFKGSVSAFGISKSNPDVMYVFSTTMWDDTGVGLIFKSMDGGSSWTDITTNVGYPWAYVTSVEISPYNSNELWVGLSFSGFDNVNKVYHSKDGGNTWTALSNNYPPGILINELEYDSENNVLYAATDVGVLVWDRIENKWYEFTDCLPKGIVTDIVINNSDRKIRASVFGHGLWEANLWFCPDNNSPINLSGTVNNNTKSSTNSTISSTQNTNYKEVTYESAQEVILSDGFTGYSGFTAIANTIKSCNTGCDNTCMANLKSAVLKSAQNFNNEKVSMIESDNYNIYPNPSDGRLIVEFPEKDFSVKKISILSISGINIMDIYETAPSIYIDISGNPSGIYVINIEKEGKIHSESIIIK